MHRRGSAPPVRADLEARRRLPDAPRGVRHRGGRHARRTRDATGADATCSAPTGSTLVKPGFLAVYHEEDEDETDDESEDEGLPPIERGRARARSSRSSRAAFHRAAAALHRGRAGQGAGGARHRPSVDLCLDHLDTQDREYVEMDGRASSRPTSARSSVKFLSKHFARYVEYGFTARMEDVLDAIARARRNGCL